MEKETPTNGWKCGDCGEEIEVTPLTFVNPHICKETPTECCEKCGADYRVGKYCTNPNCPCHKETPTEEWAKKKV